MTVARERWALGVLLAATAALYLWNLSATGYGNAFYAAAAQAGAQSWSAWFYGSLDAHNFITVDKPPASLWVAGLSVRLFGMNSWAVLAPQALMGVASVAVLQRTVRGAFADPEQGAAAGLIAAAGLAFTPVAAAMFRFNNPDALLTLLLTVAAYCTMRAIGTASWRWLAGAGAVMGAAFLTKMLVAFVVLPAFALSYLMFAPISWTRRILHLVAAAVSLTAAAGWWIAVVEVGPADRRPYIGGSTDNSVLDLAFGYNGMGRIDGQRHTAYASQLGLHRLFSGETGNEIAWLIPAAVFALAFGLYLAARRRLNRNELASLTMWGSWLAVTGLLFSYMKGTVQPYYTVILAPSIAALVGLGAVFGWRIRGTWDGRIALCALVGLTVVPAVIFLRRNHFGDPWLVSIGILAVLAIVGAMLRSARLATLAAAVGVVAALAGTAIFSVFTAAKPVHQRIGEADARVAAMLSTTNTAWSAATNGSQSAAALEIASGTSVMAVGGWSGDPVPTLDEFIEAVQSGKVSYYVETGRIAAPGTPQPRVILGPNRSISHTRDIAEWVATHYRGMVIGTSTVYHLV